jgi:hypothetical protein
MGWARALRLDDLGPDAGGEAAGRDVFEAARASERGNHD